MINVLVLFGSSPLEARAAGPVSPSPAPAPAAEFLNLTDLLTVAGPFHTFLNYLVSSKVIDTFQNQANNTQQGITIFVPKDTAFSSLKKPALTNLTKEQLKSLLLFHALPKYYSLADFESLSRSNPVNTYAGGSYTLNFTYTSGTIHVISGWSDTKISSSVHSTVPVAVYQVDKVLLPQAIFGVPPPPSSTPAPAPAPTTVPTADSSSSAPSGDASDASSPKSNSTASSSYRVNSIMSYLILVVLGTLELLL